MKKTSLVKNGIITILILIISTSCNQPVKEKVTDKDVEIIEVESENPEYFQLRPEVEKAYGYSHAVRIGNDIKISGA